MGVVVVGLEEEAVGLGEEAVVEIADSFPIVEEETVGEIVGVEMVGEEIAVAVIPLVEEEAVISQTDPILWVESPVV